MFYQVAVMQRGIPRFYRIEIVLRKNTVQSFSNPRTFTSVLSTVLLCYNPFMKNLLCTLRYISLLHPFIMYLYLFYHFRSRMLLSKGIFNIHSTSQRSKEPTRFRFPDVRPRRRSSTKSQSEDPAKEQDKARPVPRADGLRNVLSILGKNSLENLNPFP